MVWGGTLRAPAMGVGSGNRYRVLESCQVYPAVLPDTPFVPQGRATQRISFHALTELLNHLAAGDRQHR